MGIHLNDIDESNVLQAIRLHCSANILQSIPAYLINGKTCLAAVQANGMSLKYVPLIFLTNDIVEAAISENHQAIWAMSRKYITNSMLLMATQSLITKCKSSKFLKY